MKSVMEKHTFPSGTTLAEILSRTGMMMSFAEGRRVAMSNMLRVDGELASLDFTPAEGKAVIGFGKHREIQVFIEAKGG